MLMDCFSDVINENLRKNLDDNIAFCKECGEMIVKKANNQDLCSDCYKEYRKNYDREIKRRKRAKVCPQSENPSNPA